MNRFESSFYNMSLESRADLWYYTPRMLKIKEEDERMTKDERLLQELNQIRAQERARMAGQQMPQNDSAFSDSAFYEQPQNDSAFTDSAFADSAFSDSTYSDSAFGDSPQGDSAFYAGGQPVQQSVQMQRVTPQNKRPQNAQPMNRKPQSGQYQNRQPQNRQAQNRQSQQGRQSEAYNLKDKRQYGDTVYDNGTQYDYEAPRRRQRNLPPDEDESQRKPQVRKKKKKHRGLRIVRNILIILGLLALLFVYMISSIVSRFDHFDSEVSKRDTAMKGRISNILLIGQDAREGQGGQRSDSIILMTINRDENKVILTSFMRDLYVQIPGYGGNRINAAFAFGGVDLLDQTIEENFGITIDGNMIVDLNGFLEAFSAMGSLDIELTQEEADYMNEHPDLGESVNSEDATYSEDWNWSLTEGVNTLNSHQLLAYSRMRHLGNSDWDRTARQRKVIMAAINKVKHGHVFKGYGMVKKVAPHIATDISSMGMTRTLFGILFNAHMENYQLPVEGTYSNEYVDEMAVLVPDMEQNRYYLEKYINGEGSETTETGPEEESE